MKEMLKEFKEFINRGNVVDLAVGVVIGGAFTNIVTSLVNDIFMPIIGMIIGGIDFTSIAITIGDASIMIGAFIQNVINFIIIAFVVFNIVKLINKLNAAKKEPEVEAPAEDPADIVLLKSIEKELKKLNKK